MKRGGTKEIRKGNRIDKDAELFIGSTVSVMDDVGELVKVKENGVCLRLDNKKYSRAWYPRENVLFIAPKPREKGTNK